jgi:hypothetical protein
MTGIMEHALAEASRGPADQLEKSYRESFRRKIAALPYRQVQAELASLKGALEVSPRNVVIGLIQAQMDPASQSGEISSRTSGRTGRSLWRAAPT